MAYIYHQETKSCIGSVKNNNVKRFYMTIYCDPHTGQMSFFEPPPRFIKEGDLWENFLKFDAANPDLYFKFKAGLEPLFREGIKLSSYIVREVMRVTSDGRAENNFAPYYLRKLIENNPEYEKYFVLGTLKRER